MIEQGQEMLSEPLHRKHCNCKLIIFSLLVYMPALIASAGIMLLDEGFEKPEASWGFRQDIRMSAATAKQQPGGLQSDHALQVDKPDSCGSYSATWQVALEGRAQVGDWLRISLDICTLWRGPGAEYLMTGGVYSNEVRRGANRLFVFDDGIARKTKFSTYSTPQTLGEWARTEHLYQLVTPADTLHLSLLLCNGAQSVKFDNLRVENCGQDQPLRSSRRVFAKEINWPYAILDLDMLLPGAVYEVSAGIRPPDPKRDQDTIWGGKSVKPVLVSPGGSGMGIAFSTTDDRGVRTAPVELMPYRADESRLRYRLQIPTFALTTHLDLHNDDLIRLGHNHIEALARRWTDIEIELVNFGEIAADNAGWQYIYREKPEELKPRQWRTPDVFELQALKQQLSKRKAMDFEVVNHKGGMTFKLGNKLVPPILASYKEIPFGAFEALRHNGINLLMARYPYGGVSSHGDWSGVDKYHWDDLDDNIYAVLIQNPDAHLILSIDSLYPPLWWSQQNRAEIVRDQNGFYCWTPWLHLYKHKYDTFDNLLKAHEASLARGNRMHEIRGLKLHGFFLPSTASLASRRVLDTFLRDLRKHVEAQPYGNAVVGYRLVAGYDGQWGPVRDDHGYDTLRKGVHYKDFSQPMAEYFQQYVRRKYDTIAKVRAAWREPELADFDAITLPGIKGRYSNYLETGNALLLDPIEYQKLIDYHECYGLSVGETLLSYCHSLKQAAKRKVVTMAYYPDIAERPGGLGGSLRGNARVWRDPAGLDAAGGPNYDARDIGLAQNCNAMVDSLKLHGKIHLTEIDHRLFPVAKRNNAGNILFDTPRKTLAILRREYTKQMCMGHGSWTFDMGMGWFSDPFVARMIGDAYKVFENVLDLDRHSVAQVAVFIGEHGKNVQTERLGSIPHALGKETLSMLPHVGVPVDLYLMSDLPKVAKRYKVFYFPFAYGLTPQEYANIESLKRKDNLLVFGINAGYVTTTRSIDNIAKLIGMEIAQCPSYVYTVKINESAHPLVANINGFFTGSDGNKATKQGLLPPVLPPVHIIDPKAIKLGTFTDSDDRVGFAFKDHGSWQSLYLGWIGWMPHAILRNAAAYKGVHVYSDQGDVLFINRSLVGIHATSNGRKVITLPRSGKVKSLWDQIDLGETEVIEREMRVGDTALYVISHK